jgi:hypothetical protein
VSSFGRNDDFFVGGKEEAKQQQISPLRCEMANKRTGNSECNGNSRSFDFAQDDRYFNNDKRKKRAVTPCFQVDSLSGEGGRAQKKPEA